MNSDRKKRKIQQKYREKMEQKKFKKRHTIEASFMIFLVILLVLLGGFDGDQSNVPIVEKVDEFEKGWILLVPQMDDALKTASSQYKSMTIDFNPKSITYYLDTSIQKSESDHDQTASELINITNEIIVGNSLPILLKENETYEIVVRGEEREPLTREVFH